MPRLKPVVVIRQPYIYGSGGEDGVDFIQCVSRWEPQIHEFWTFAEDGVTREVHPFARIDVGNLSDDFFQTDYFTEVGRTVVIYGQRSINGSV